MASALSLEQVIKQLDLQPHAEGGHFRETWCDEGSAGTKHKRRSCGTAIYFLVDGRKQWTRKHRIDAAEVWHFYMGAPLQLKVGDEDVVTLGTDLLQGQEPQATVPANAWQQARSTGEWSLVGCTVAPGFELEHFEVAPSGRRCHNVIVQLLEDAGSLLRRHEHRQATDPSEPFEFDDSILCTREIADLREAFGDVTAGLTRQQWSKHMTQLDDVLVQLETLVQCMEGGRRRAEELAEDGSPRKSSTAARTFQTRQRSRWARFDTPRRHWLQTFAVANCCFFVGMPLYVTFNALVIRRSPLGRKLLLAYFSYILFDNWRFAKRVRPKHAWFCNSRYWKWFRDYFPARLVVPKQHRPLFTSDRSYLFVLHPHGIHVFGGGSLFHGNAGGLLQKFIPAVKQMHIHSLKPNFWIPFWRELFVLGGAMDASAASISAVLAAGNGHASALTPGGAEESLASSPHTADLTLRKRKGFVKLALRHGASLVPVFTFGETSTYDNWLHSNPKLGKVLRKLQKLLGFAMPLIKGRGLFLFNMFLPNRVPLHTVVGKPVDLPKIDAPTPEDVDRYHDLYVQALMDLYDEYKSVYDLHSTRAMRIVS